MPELLCIETESFEFSVWCNDVSRRQQTYQSMLQQRGVGPLFANVSKTHLIKFQPAINILSTFIHPSEESNEPQPQVKVLDLQTPLFFENVQYQFEWVFLKPVSEAYLLHPNQKVSDGFRFAPARHGMHSRLTGTINTANDVGWLRLPVFYVSKGKQYKEEIALEVLPVKMDLHQDLPAMYQAIDTVMPLWRFSLLAKTTQQVSKGSRKGYFPLLWLANFKSLREQFELGLRVISNAPHSRLQKRTNYQKAERIKGRISSRAAEKIVSDRRNGQTHKKYHTQQQVLSFDTPENRFVKMVVSECKRHLTDIESKLSKVAGDNGANRLSDKFLEDLHQWHKPLNKILNQSFLKDVGSYKRINRESLVLQQKTGYASIYRVWQDLKFYLDLFAHQSDVAMKSVDKVYEVWCFLQVKEILEKLGFELKSAPKLTLNLNQYYEYQLQDGLNGAFEFERSDGVTAKLAHEPRFKKQGTSIRTFLVEQRPDIVLEVTLPLAKSKSFIWLFDAKYRIDITSQDNVDMVPSDAINQLHRYRDALIRVTEDKTIANQVSKTRPVFGAFALYPGYFNQSATLNPYQQQIDEVGIGAFALLPSENGTNSGHLWLFDFLRQQIGANQADDFTYGNKLNEEYFYVQEPARIPYCGMEQFLYSDLTFTVSLGLPSSRSSDYFDAFKDGMARWYHIPQETFSIKFKHHVLKELRFIAIAVEDDNGEKSIARIWPVNHVTLVKRSDISALQAGTASSSNKPYYLFELGKSLQLSHVINDIPTERFRDSMRLTTLTNIEQAVSFEEVVQVYQQAWQ